MIKKITQTNKILEELDSNNYYKTSHEKMDYTTLIKDNSNMSIIDLLILSFSRYNNEAEKLLDDILAEAILIKDELDVRSAYNILFISVALGKENQVINKFNNSIKKHLQKPSTEQKIFLLYKHAVDTLDNKSIKKLCNFIQNEEFVYVDKSIEGRVTSSIKLNIDKLLYSNLSNKEKYIEISIDKYPIYKSFKLIPSNIPYCIEHMENLESKNICLIQYCDNTYSLIKNMIDTIGYFCPLCKTIYVLEDTFKKLKETYGNDGFNID